MDIYNGYVIARVGKGGTRIIRKATEEDYKNLELGKL